MVRQKGGIFQWILMNQLLNKNKKQPQAQKGGLYIHRKKHKQKGGRAYTSIEEIRRRHFRKTMLKAMRNKRIRNQKGGFEFIHNILNKATGQNLKYKKPPMHKGIWGPK